MAVQNKEIIIVLGGGVNEDGSLTDQSKERVDRALQIFRKNPARYLLVSSKYSFAINFVPRKTEAKAMRDYAFSSGVPSKKVILEDRSVDTTGNMLFAEEIIRRMHGVRSLILVTSSYHMQRSRYLFEKFFGKRFRVSFVSSKSRLSNEKLKLRKKSEKETLDLIKRFYRDVKNGDFKEMRRRILINHPLYATDISTVPQSFWEGFETRGFTRRYIASKRIK